MELLFLTTAKATFDLEKVVARQMTAKKPMVVLFFFFFFFLMAGFDLINSNTQST